MNGGWTPGEISRWNRQFDRILRGWSGHMNLKRWKLIKALVANVGIVSLAAYSLSLGADPTTISLAAIVVLGLINGMEMSEFVATYAELQADRQDTTDDGGSS